MGCGGNISMGRKEGSVTITKYAAALASRTRAGNVSLVKVITLLVHVYV